MCVRLARFVEVVAPCGHVAADRKPAVALDTAADHGPRTTDHGKDRMWSGKLLVNGMHAKVP